MKRVLIITYYWPPAGGISVHRSLKIAKYLRDFGWEPVIYTAKNAQYPYFDESNNKDIPKGITVLKKAIIEPFNLFKKLSGRKKNESLNNILQVRDKKRGLIDSIAIWVRGNFFIPDARSLWIRPSVKFLTRYLRKNPVDAIFSDGPPHTNTVIACHLKKSIGIPWLADFQDPWTQVDYLKLFPLSKRASEKHRRMEQEVFKNTDQITMVSPSWGRNLESIGAKDVKVIYWGYDDDDFDHLAPVPDDQFTITHTGLLGFDRNNEAFLACLQEIKAEIPAFADKLKLQLAGQVDYSVIQSLKKYDLEANLINLGIIDRSQALQLMLNSQLLLLPLNKADNAAGRIPGKFFEYLRARRPILCFGPADGDVKKIIDQTQSGQSFEYGNSGDLKSYLIKQFHKFERKNIAFHGSDISHYSVRNQTQKIASILDKITADA